MAKALLGHLGADPRTLDRLTAENLRLRRRVADLEAMVLRLQADADRHEAAAMQAQLDAESMQPV